jgi:hypothetical protein
MPARLPSKFTPYARNCGSSTRYSPTNPPSATKSPTTSARKYATTNKYTSAREETGRLKNVNADNPSLAWERARCAARKRSRSRGTTAQPEPGGCAATCSRPAQHLAETDAQKAGDQRHVLEVGTYTKFPRQISDDHQLGIQRRGAGDEQKQCRISCAACELGQVGSSLSGIALVAFRGRKKNREGVFYTARILPLGGVLKPQSLRGIRGRVSNCNEMS